MNSLTYLSSESFSSIPSDLTSDLRRMLSANETSRPTASDFTGENIDHLVAYYYSLQIYADINFYVYALETYKANNLHNLI